MKIKLLKDTGVYSKGDVVEMVHPRAVRYIGAGLAEQYVEPKEEKPKAKKAAPKKAVKAKE